MTLNAKIIDLPNVGFLDNNKVVAPLKWQLAQLLKIWGEEIT